MASDYKRPADKGKKNKPWLIEYVDHEGKRAYAKGFSDKAMTEQLAAKLENEVMLRKRGMIDPAQERLLAIRQSPIGDHLAAFDRSLDNTTPKHRKLTILGQALSAGDSEWPTVARHLRCFIGEVWGTRWQWAPGRWPR